jgi:hypothetical protein
MLVQAPGSQASDAEGEQVKEVEEEEWFFPKHVAFPWVIVAGMLGALIGFMFAASAVPPGCFK